MPRGKRPTDQERADYVLEFYGFLKDSKAIVPPGYFPREHVKDAKGLEYIVRKRLNNLLHGENQKVRTSAGPLEAAALCRAGLTLLEVEGAEGRRVIDRNNNLKESDYLAHKLDLQRAADVEAYFGLDGTSEAMANIGERPSGRAPKGASEFEKRVRNRLYELARGDGNSVAGPAELAALDNARMPLVQINGRYRIGESDEAGSSQAVVDAVSPSALLDADDVLEERSSDAENMQNLTDPESSYGNSGAWEYSQQEPDPSVQYTLPGDHGYSSADFAPASDSQYVDPAGMHGYAMDCTVPQDMIASAMPLTGSAPYTNSSDWDASVAHDPYSQDGVYFDGSFPSNSTSSYLANEIEDFTVRSSGASPKATEQGYVATQYWQAPASSQGYTM